MSGSLFGRWNRAGIMSGTRGVSVAASQFVGAAVSYGARQLAGAVGNVVTRDFGYAGERQFTNHIADPSQIISAFWSGQLSAQLTSYYLACHGIKYNYFQPLPDNENQRVWKAVIDDTQPKLDVGTTVDLYHSHRIEWPEAMDRLKLHGLTRPGDRGHLLRNRGLIDLSAAHDAWWAGRVDDAEYRRRVIAAGVGEVLDIELALADRPVVDLDQVRSDSWLNVVGEEATRERYSRHGMSLDGVWREHLLAQSPLGADLAIFAYRRFLIGEDRLDAELGLAGYITEAQRDLYTAATRPMPSAADLVEFAVREVWDEGIAARFGYDDEIPPQYIAHMSQLGMTYVQSTGPNVPDNELPIRWDKAYWRAHWRVMPVGLAYDALHRLRPERIERYQDAVPGVVPFLPSDMGTVLRINDYPPAVRQWMHALSYRTLTIREVRTSYLHEAQVGAWALEQLQDLGYTREVSQELIKLWDAQKEWTRLAPIRALDAIHLRQTVAQVMKNLDIGIVDEAYAIEALKVIGVSDETADGMVALARGAAEARLAAENIKALKRAFMGGEYSADELPAALGTLGIVPSAAQQYYDHWLQLRSFKRRVATSSEILRWVGDGLIQPVEAQRRLGNLGWNDSDVLLAVRVAQMQLDRVEGRAMSAAERVRTKQISELEKANRDALAAVARNQAALRRLTPKADIKKWLCDDMVSKGWVLQRLAAMGYPPDVAQAYVDDWQKGGKCAGSTSPPPPPPPPATPGALPPPTGGGGITAVPSVVLEYP